MPKVVILGGGFGGVRVGLDLERSVGEKVEIVLVNDSHSHCYIPDLYDVSTALLRGDRKKDYRNLISSVDIHLDKIFKNKKVRLVFDKVLGIDLEKKTVELEKKEELEYDFLVIA